GDGVGRADAAASRGQGAPAPPERFRGPRAPRPGAQRAVLRRRALLELAVLRRQPEHALRVLHGRHGIDPALRGPRRDAGLGARLRPRPRARPLGGAQPLRGVLGPRSALPARRAGPRLPDRQGNGDLSGYGGPPARNTTGSAWG